MDDNTLDFGKAVLLDRKPTPSPEEEMEAKLQTEVLSQMLVEAKLNLFRAQVEDEFLGFLDENGVMFESEHYQKLLSKERGAHSDTVIYYDQRVEFLYQQITGAERKVQE
jgi:hypothetical protein